jgi:hypothetical protein
MAVLSQSSPRIFERNDRRCNDAAYQSKTAASKKGYATLSEPRKGHAFQGFGAALSI